jgi:heme A synthase
MGNINQEITRADTLSKKARRERTMIIVTILLALFIIVSMIGILIVMLMLEPKEVVETLEQEGMINIAELLSQVSKIMGGG